MPAAAPRRTHHRRRCGTAGPHAADPHAATGKAITSMTPRHRSEKPRKSLNLIDKEILANLDTRIALDNFQRGETRMERTRPANLDTRIALDNASTRKTSATQRRLVRHPRIKLHLTPTYSSSTNLAERRSPEPTAEQLRRGGFRRGGGWRSVGPRNPPPNSCAAGAFAAVGVGGASVPGTHRRTAAPRRPHQRRRPPRLHQRPSRRLEPRPRTLHMGASGAAAWALVGGRLEPRPRTLHMAQDRRRDPRDHSHTSTTNSPLRTLEACLREQASRRRA